jgi:hypothetical protein
MVCMSAMNSAIPRGVVLQCYINRNKKVLTIFAICYLSTVPNHGAINQSMMIIGLKE